MSEYDIEIIQNIVKYCQQIDEANLQFDENRRSFESSSVYRNAAAMCVLQIGELAKRLTDEFKTQTAAEIPWHDIQGLRNVVAHEYGKIDTESLWETITEDIPRLCEFCNEKIREYDQQLQSSTFEPKM